MTVKKNSETHFHEMKKIIYRRASNVTQTFDMQIKGMGDFFYSSLKGEDFNIHKKRSVNVFVSESAVNDEIAVVKLNARNLMYSTCDLMNNPHSASKPFHPEDFFF